MWNGLENVEEEACGAGRHVLDSSGDCTNRAARVARSDLDPVGFTGSMTITADDLVSVAPPADDEARIDAAIALAAELLRAAEVASGAVERKVRRRLRRVSGIVGKPAAQDLAIALTDEVMRIDDPKRAARGFRALVAQTPSDALGTFDRLQLRVGALASAVLPRTVMRLVERRVRADSAGVVLPAEAPALGGHLAARRAEGMRANVNVLGEAILSDAEAHERRRLILEQLARPDVDYVSVKLSAISAHVSALSFDGTVAELVDTVLPVMRAAAATTPNTPASTFFMTTSIDSGTASSLERERATGPGR